MILGQLHRKMKRTKLARPAAALAVSAPVEHTDSRVLVMDAKEFERFHKCMTIPARPSKAIIEAAKLHRLLLVSRKQKKI